MSATRSNPLILVVEDDLTTRLTLQGILGSPLGDHVPWALDRATAHHTAADDRVLLGIEA